MHSSSSFLIFYSHNIWFVKVHFSDMLWSFFKLCYFLSNGKKRLFICNNKHIRCTYQCNNTPIVMESYIFCVFAIFLLVCNFQFLNSRYYFKYSTTQMYFELYSLHFYHVGHISWLWLISNFTWLLTKFLLKFFFFVNQWFIEKLIFSFKILSSARYCKEF